MSDGLGLWALGHFLEEAIQSLWRARVRSTLAIGIIGLSLATVGAFLLVAENLRGVVERMGSLEVSVYLEDTASPETVAGARRAVEAAPGFLGLRLVTKEQALAGFRAAHPELAGLPAALGENPFPPSIEVTFDESGRTPDAVARFAEALEGVPGVVHVSRDLEIAGRVLAASRIVRAVAGFLGGVLLLSALFTVSNVVRLDVYARRDEVEILRLVGATAAYVRGTFVTQGLLQGLAGSLLALALLAAGYGLAGSWVGASGIEALASLTTRFLSGSSQALLVCAGTALGAVGSLLPLRAVART